jgi:glucose/mannose-6-phosphate isomerase
MILDKADTIARIDAGGMLALVGRMGAMVEEAWEAAADLPLTAQRPAAVAVCGMGGSGIGGDLLRSLLAPDAPVPVVTVKGERLPAFVGPGTLAFACSYSGNTGETLAAFGAAAEAGATPIAVTSGGALAEGARALGYPLVLVPGGLPPRSALPFLLMPMLRAASDAGLSRIGEPDVREASALLNDLARMWAPGVPLADNLAKHLAVTMGGTIPVIYAASPATEPAAQRWKTQLNENSKVFAAWNTFPELTHNETVGWEGVRGGDPALSVVVLRDRQDPARSALMVEAVRDLLAGRAREVTEVWSRGEGLLARLFSLILLGDLASCYLAVLRGVDPTPVRSIEEVKARLRAPS